MKRAPSAWFPFLDWFPMNREGIRADIVAGVTVALILVPQAMAYALLAGLPVIYGLYAALIPVVVASLWGSLRQLHTGPTAILSLMSAAALVPLASPGSEDFIELSIMLALLVGILRLVLGLLRLGLIVNFLSHPVVIGFTNAAALIIGLSQLNKLIGVPMPRSDMFLQDVWVVLQQLASIHWPTMGFAIAAFGIIFFLQKKAPRLPAVLIAIAVTTLTSYLTGFERLQQAPIAAIESSQVQAQIERFREIQVQIKTQASRITQLQTELARLQAEADTEATQLALIDARAGIDRSQAVVSMLRAEQHRLRVALHQIDLVRAEDGMGQALYSYARSAPEGEPVGVGHWRIGGVEGDQVLLTGGGEVVGRVPPGLPDFRMPMLDWHLLLQLLPAALVMALLGFMEATSISKAIAAKTKQRVDTNKELIGQGLANIVGSFFQAYTVSGSFSRSAIAAQAGARTGLFAIISAIGVLLVILFLTDWLYHLPQAVLAVIIMFAVFSLIRIRVLIQAWRVNRLDALVGIATFVATLLMAPALANGILVGIALTVMLYLFRNMRPRAEVLGWQQDGSLGGIDTHGLAPISRNYVVLRFDGSLNFVNVAYFEDALLQSLARFPEARALLVIGNGINDIDVTGEEKIRALAGQLKEMGVTLYFSSLKRQVRQVFDGDGLVAVIPADHIFKTKEQALRELHACYG